MADDKRNTPNERRKRSAPTIDLSATEVSAEPPPPQSAETNGSPPTGATARNARPIFLAVAAGGFAGAAIVLGALWLEGMLPPGKSSDDLTARIAALETQAKAAKTSNGQPIHELESRIGKLEQAPKPATTAADPAFSERLASVENAMKALGVTLTALNRRAEDSASAVSAVQAKLDSIEQSAKAARDKVAQSSAADALARRALAALTLRDEVARGAPYAAQLAAVKQLGADAQSVAALEPLAASGVPSADALSGELNALLPAMIDAIGADAPKANGFLERLQADAGKLVRIHRVGESAGDDPSAVLARIEVKAAHSDLAGAAAELDKLPLKTRVLADEWRNKLAARNAAIAASRKLVADSAAALGAP